MRLTPLALHRSIAPRIFSAVWRIASAFHTHGFNRSALAQAELWQAIDNADTASLASAIANHADFNEPATRSGARLSPIGFAILNRWSSGEAGLDILQILLDHGADPNHRLFDRGWAQSTPLTIGEPIVLRALRHGDFDAAYILCFYGARLDAPDDSGLDAYGLSMKMSGSNDIRREAYARFLDAAAELCSRREAEELANSTHLHQRIGHGAKTETLRL